MSRDEAVKVMAGYLAMSSSINSLGNFRSYLNDEADKDQVAMVSVEVVSLIYEKGMKPIIAKFPDLDPDA